ncbi:MAG: hypothetical protein EOO04_10910 [Chitinophagaceae bacterium]|nr:MAG: hypothetical protein EOO04_10910 [Chitinophagaceae bacterium]
MSTSTDHAGKKDKHDNKDFPVREGKGVESSIRGDEDSGVSGDYPEPGKDDQKFKNQDEYNNMAKEKNNKTEGTSQS